MATKKGRASDTVRLLNEAVALEAAGGTWSQKHAAAVAGYSVAFLRASDCPKEFEEGNGPKGRPRVVYLPAKVREWKAARRITQLTSKAS
jgi:hypothetical protein